MIVLIVTLVMKIMEYVKKIIIMIIFYQNLVFIPWGWEWNGHHSVKEEGLTKYQELNRNEL
jgi:hypothetical protein